MSASAGSSADQLEAICGAGGLAILSHPKIREFSDAQGPTYTADRLVNELRGLYDGAEIYTHNVGSGLKLAIDRLDVVWTSRDPLWSGPEDHPPRPVWAFAGSDGHSLQNLTEDVGIIVWADELSPPDIRASLAAGAFYSLANTEARFGEIAVDGDTIRATASNAVMMRVVRSAGLAVRVVSRERAGSIEIGYTLRGDEGYVRVEAMDAGGRCAYTNPVFTWKADVEAASGEERMDA